MGGTLLKDVLKSAIMVHLVLYVMTTGMNMMLKSYVGNWDIHLKVHVKLQTSPLLTFSSIISQQVPFQ